MIFQSGKYCDILIYNKEYMIYGDATRYTVRIRDTGDTHLDITCKDLSHALELFTAIERSPEVKIVVNVNDYIHIENTLDTAKDGQWFNCPNCMQKVQERKRSEGQCIYSSIDVNGIWCLYADRCGCIGWQECDNYKGKVNTRGEFADCRHRPITKEDCDLREFDLEEMA